MKKQQREDRGVAAVEFALVVPLLFSLIFGMIEFGVAYNYRTRLNSAAQVAAREAAITHNDAQAKATLRSLMGLPASHAVTMKNQLGSAVSPICPAVESTNKNTVIVTVTVNRPTLTNFFGSTFPISGKGVAECM